VPLTASTSVSSGPAQAGSIPVASARSPSERTPTPRAVKYGWTHAPGLHDDRSTTTPWSFSCSGAACATARAMRSRGFYKSAVGRAGACSLRSSSPSLHAACPAVTVLSGVASKSSPLVISGSSPDCLPPGGPPGSVGVVVVGDDAQVERGVEADGVVPAWSLMAEPCGEGGRRPTQVRILACHTSLYVRNVAAAGLVGLPGGSRFPPADARPTQPGRASSRRGWPTAARSRSANPAPRIAHHTGMSGFSFSISSISSIGTMYSPTSWARWSGHGSVRGRA
jgi:hypothetical protein